VLLSLLVLTGAIASAADTPDPKPSPAAIASPRPAAKPKPATLRTSPAPAASPASQASPAKAASPAAPKERVYTNEDLPKEPSPAPSLKPGTGRGTVTVIGPEGQAPVVVEEPAGPVEPEATEQFWRERADGIRNNISTIEQQMATLQERISELRNDRGQANAMDPNREQTRQARIAEAQAEYDRAAADLERVRQSLADLAEEARQKNIPPGWVR
jgi:hypothetical protein